MLAVPRRRPKLRLHELPKPPDRHLEPVEPERLHGRGDRSLVRAAGQRATSAATRPITRVTHAVVRVSRAPAERERAARYASRPAAALVCARRPAVTREPRAARPRYRGAAAGAPAPAPSGTSTAPVPPGSGTAAAATHSTSTARRARAGGCVTRGRVTAARSPARLAAAPGSGRAVIVELRGVRRAARGSHRHG